MKSYRDLLLNKVNNKPIIVKNEKKLHTVIDQFQTAYFDNLDKSLNLMSVMIRLEIANETGQISPSMPSKKNPFVLRDSQGPFFL